MISKKEYIYIISDSAGETASTVVNAAIAQYPQLNLAIVKNIFINDQPSLETTLESAKHLNAIIIHTMISKDFIEYVNDYCAINNLYCLDILSPLVDEINRRTSTEPNRVTGASHVLNKQYFNRMEAMEFAVTYDDGKDPKGLLEADIVLLGVSRTSKTPLSLYLANKNLKVANLPLVPQAVPPKELWQVDSKKIIGLMNDPQLLNRIREDRMVSYGLDPHTPYSDIDNIEKELAYAQTLYNKLGCIVINVANRSIEETASMILHQLGLDDYSYHG